MKKIKFEGELELANGLPPLACYVLEDGTRVLSGRGMQEALKLVDEKAPPSGQKPGTRLTRYLEQKTLKPYIYKGKSEDHFKPIECMKGNTKINGYEATVLVDICDGFLEARKHIALSTRQSLIAEQCEILLRSFAKVGIIALVDEATGYQYQREKHELQAILKLFISNDILEWQKTFHLGFYKEIFRLWGVPFTPQNIKRKPPFIGHITNTFVYNNLPKGSFVLKKLKEKTPKTEAGNYKVRLFQSLTDFGRQELVKVISSIETLAAISDSKEKFKKLVDDRYGQVTLPFNDFESAPSNEEKPTGFDNVLKGLLAVPPPKKGKDSK